MKIAVIGKFSDNSCHENKTVRAYAMMGHTVFPITKKQEFVEGIETHKKPTDVPYRMDRISVHIPAEESIKIINQIKACGAKEIYITPGCDSPELLNALKKAGLKTQIACPITAINLDASTL